MPPPRFHAPDARAGDATVTLPADEARHLARVLRLEVGTIVRVFDGNGHEWQGRVAEVARDTARVSLDEVVEPPPEPGVRVTLGIGLLKGAQMDAVVRDATALGVTAIAPLDTAHVAVPAAGRRDAAAARWRRIAVAAAKQSGRAHVPDVRSPTPIVEVVERAVAAGAALIACFEPRAAPPAAVGGAPGPRPDAALLCVGPEGGWAPPEIDLFDRHGAIRLAMGPRTLRAELVPAVALSVLWAHWGW